jgi:hypothetical protein
MQHRHVCVRLSLVARSAYSLDVKVLLSASFVFWYRNTQTARGSQEFPDPKGDGFERSNLHCTIEMQMKDSGHASHQIHLDRTKY